MVPISKALQPAVSCVVQETDAVESKVCQEGSREVTSHVALSSHPMGCTQATTPVLPEAILGRYNHANAAAHDFVMPVWKDLTGDHHVYH